MSRQSEQILEEQVIAQLQKLGYKPVTIRDEKDLLANLKTQLEKHNKIELSAKEFDKVLNILNKGSVFEKAKTLREKQHIIRDNGENLYFEFLDSESWCQNEFQVTNQVTIEGTYKTRYDVTILINGLPLCQIELKRRGLELKEAFNQVNRYHRHSYASNSALFQYVQVFVISNGVNTKYYANNRKQSFNQTFYWTDKENKRVTNILNGFSEEFLEPCNLSKLICKYIVLNETHKVMMVLRPYQFYAVESLVQVVKETNKNGYVWHTTGSGKTLTSFKASQILTKIPEVKKVVFVVDRKDLDYQTTKEFNSFSKGSIDGTDNTRALVKQFEDDTKLIVTTIQKLNTAISKKHYSDKMDKLKDEKMVFIFDECHRSQFGETHGRIKKFFNNIQLFGFTGTPIFKDNAVKNALGKRTTKELFGDCLHKYVITDAIRDENVLKFAVEYIGRYREKEESRTEVDIEVENIDVQEIMDSSMRLEKISDYIIQNHNRKTHNKDFSAMFCVSSVKTLIKYYDILKRKKDQGEHNLNIATIFSYGVNEDDPDANGLLENDEVPLVAEARAGYGLDTHSRDKLESYIQDYNRTFNTDFTTKDSEKFYLYHNDLSKKLKDREKDPENPDNRIDILLVVNMFLTGFDAKKVNTLYVDKNLKHHGLIQAFSRTNRILNDKKSQGNIVVFRNLKAATDEAITLFSNKEAIEEIIVQPYEDYVAKFNKQFEELLKIVPTIDSVNDLESEEDELKFVQAFRELIRTRNVLITFSDFDWKDLDMYEQEFEDYKSKYLDLFDKTKQEKEKVSILEDIDFELDLIHRDEINVAYILQLLIKLKGQKASKQEETKKQILALLGSEVNLRSKKELIEKFINENLPKLGEDDDVTEEFEKYWDEEQKAAFNKIITTESLSHEKTEVVIENYLFAEKKPLRDELLGLIVGAKPTLLERKPRSERIMHKIVSYVDTFVSGFRG